LQRNRKRGQGSLWTVTPDEEEEEKKKKKKRRGRRGKEECADDKVLKV
jgi:hypothetical protein